MKFSIQSPAIVTKHLLGRYFTWNSPLSVSAVAVSILIQCRLLADVSGYAKAAWLMFICHFVNKLSVQSASECVFIVSSAADEAVGRAILVGLHKLCCYRLLAASSSTLYFCIVAKGGISTFANDTFCCIIYFLLKTLYNFYYRSKWIFRQRVLGAYVYNWAVQNADSRRLLSLSELAYK